MKQVDPAGTSCQCLRCGHCWNPRAGIKPRCCAFCKDPRWDQERKLSRRATADPEIAVHMPASRAKV